MDVQLRELVARQRDLVSAWQLRGLGWSWDKVRYHAAEWRAVHRGVYALTQAPLSREQRRLAATLTTPETVLSHASAGAVWGFRPWEAGFETVTRPGAGGRLRLPGLVVCRSKTLDGDTTVHAGIPITSVARTLIDLAARLDDRATARAFREAIRLKLVTPHVLDTGLERHRGRPGSRLLTDLARRYAHLPYARTRSNAESRALEVLSDAGVEPPLVNARIAGEEADLTWPKRRLIIEIDGPQYHLFPDEDARKQRVWEAAGYTVRRIPSGLVFDSPATLIALATAP